MQILMMLTGSLQSTHVRLVDLRLALRILCYLLKDLVFAVKMVSFSLVT